MDWGKGGELGLADESTGVLVSFGSVEAVAAGSGKGVAVGVVDVGATTG